MSDRVLFRQTSAKETNAQTQPMQPRQQMVESAEGRSLPEQQK